MSAFKGERRQISFRASEVLIGSVEARCRARGETKQRWLERAVRSALLAQEWADGEPVVQSHADLRDQLRARTDQAYKERRAD